MHRLRFFAFGDAVFRRTSSPARDIGDVRLELLDAVALPERRLRSPLDSSAFSRGAAASLLLGVVVARRCFSRGPESVIRCSRRSASRPMRSCPRGAARSALTPRRCRHGARSYGWGHRWSVRLFARAPRQLRYSPARPHPGVLPFFSPDARSLGFLTNDKLRPTRSSPARRRRSAT